MCLLKRDDSGGVPKVLFAKAGCTLPPLRKGSCFSVIVFQNADSDSRAFSFNTDKKSGIFIVIMLLQKKAHYQFTLELLVESLEKTSSN